jgi:hypothetical protein
LARGRERWIDLLVLLVYVLISLAMSYPLPARMQTHVPGRRQADARVFQWNNWWVKQALLKGLDLYFTEYMFYPSGVSLAGHNFDWISSFLSVPLDLLLGPAVAYNLMFLLTLFLSGFSAYLLVRYLVNRRDAAFVAGLVFAFFPYHLSGNWDGQMNLANIQWIPLSVLYVLRMIDRKRTSDAVLAGIFVAFASLDCWYFVVFLGMWGGAFVAYSLVSQRSKWTWQTVRLFALSALVSGVLVAPFLWPVIAGSGQGTVGDALEYYAERKSTDLLAFVTPSSDHPLLSQIAASTYTRFSHWRPAFVGYTVLALVLYAATVVHKKSMLWTFTGLLFAALALGTVLRVNGTEYPGIPLPFRFLVTVLPAFRLIRQASRFNVMVGLSLAVLVGIACADIALRLQRRRLGGRAWWGQFAIIGAVSALILFEYLSIPCPLQPVQLSPFYTQLAQRPEDFAIVELPLGLPYAGRSLYAQTIHNKKLVNGYVARAAHDADAFVYSSLLLKSLQLRIEPDPTLHNLPYETRLLALNNIRFIVIHTTPTPPMPAVEKDVLAAWRRLFGPTPFYQDDEIIVYEIEPVSRQSTLPQLRFGEGLALAEVRTQRTRLLDGHFLTVDLTWQALADVERTYDCVLTVEHLDGTIVESEQRRISPHYPTVRWGEGVFVGERYAVQLDPSLPGGDFRLAIEVRDTSSGQRLGAQALTIQVPADARPLASSLDEISVPIDVTFGDKMWLLGCDHREDGGRLTLDLYWHVLETMDTNYKIFVHLVRLNDGTIAAQQDTMPRGWSYPTSYWSRQETFIDRVELDISAVEPGEYALALGVYKPGRGRLPAIGPGGYHFPDDRVPIKEVIALGSN